MRKFILLALLAAGCTGEHGSHCYDNKTCNGDLVCVQLGTEREPACFKLTDIIITYRDGTVHTLLDTPCK